MNNTINSQEPVKIVLIGLDNSGKTSILLSLQKETNIMSFYSLKPTHGLNITDLMDENQKFILWELGGQQKYRDDYLKEINKYTDEANKIIFVIDVQDTSRYTSALDYLSAIFKNLENKKAEISIFFHKFDPGLEKVEKFSTEKIASTLINRINNIIPPEYEFKIFKTSIYAIFQKSRLQ